MKTIIPNQKVLITRNGCFLENCIVEELQRRKLNIKILCRGKEKNLTDTPTNLEFLQASLSRPESFKGYLEDVHTVISALDFSKINKGIFDTEIDYQNHLNLLKEAEKAGVKKFVYVMRTEAGTNESGKPIKNFSNVLKASGISYSILRVNALFSDFDKILSTTHTRKIFVSWEKAKPLNPIHPKDLAKACVDAIETLNLDITIGGPEVLTSKEIIKMAIKAHQNRALLIFPNYLFYRSNSSSRKYRLFFTTEKHSNSIKNKDLRETVYLKYGKLYLGRFFQDQVGIVKNYELFMKLTL